MRELQSIVDYGVINPTLDPTFGPSAPSPGLYWSATSLPRFPTYAYYFRFVNAIQGFTTKPRLNSVRAVRGGP